MIGTRLGNCELIEEIGRGGMATVYKAYQPTEDRYVAVKVISRGIATDTVSLERFNREARLIAQLEHPHILPVYSFDGRSDPPYIIMRYLPSGTLKDILERGKLPPADVVFLVRQMASALDFAHRRGVIHRDIKPSNILIDGDGNAFLTDFGIARIAEGNQQLTGTGITVGTPSYMAPEQGLGTAVDGRADVYSLGIMVYEMLTGDLPFKAETPMAVILKHLHEEPPDISAVRADIPYEINKVLQRALAKKAADRYSSAGEFARALAAAVQSDTQTAPIHLRTAAELAIRELEAARNAQGTVTAKAPRTPYAMSTKPVVQRRAGQTLMIGGIVGAVAFAVLILLLLATRSADNSGTQTAVALGALQTQLANSQATFTAQAATRNATGGTPTPADTIGTTISTPPTPIPVILATVDATETVTATDTDSPILRLSPTQQATTAPTERVALAITAEGTDLPTETATRSEMAIGTATHTPSDTPRPTVTATPTRTYTSTPSSTPSATPTATASFTSTFTPTFTATPTDTFTPTPIPIVLQLSTPILDPAAREYVLLFVFSSGAERVERVTFRVISEGGLAMDEVTVSRDAQQVRIPIRDIPGQTLTIRVRALGADNVVLVEQDLTTRYEPTPTPSPTATHTPTFTLTPSPTATETPTFIPTLAPTVDTSAAVTVTPATTAVAMTTGGGTLPYLNDLEAADALTAWTYNERVWSIATLSGNAALVASGGEVDLATVHGRIKPAWDDPAVRDVVFSLSVNLTDPASIARVIFRHSAAGYYVLQIRPGSLTLLRGRTGDVGTSNEDVLRNLPEMPINFGKTGPFYNLMIWSAANQTSVYMDGTRQMQVEDSGATLPGGAFLLQSMRADKLVRFDNLKVQKPLPVSTGFQTSDWPTEWERSDVTNVTLEAEAGNRGNTYVKIGRGAYLRPIIPQVPGNLFMTCRMRRENSGMQLRMRETLSGHILFDFVGGNLTISQVDPTGEMLQLGRILNFHGSRFFEFTVELYEKRVRLYREGQILLDALVDALPDSGDIRFVTRQTDIVNVDDCLFMEAKRSLTEDAAWAFERITQTETRQIRDGLIDWYDDFDGPRTQNWWEGDANAPGTFQINRDDPVHPNFLRLTYKPDAARRLFKLLRTFYVFGSGTDRRTFRDSSDLYLRVNVRVPETGTAWIMARTTKSRDGSILYGYQLSLTRLPDNQYRVTATVRTPEFERTYFEGILPARPDSMLVRWIPLLIVTYEDRVAFLADGRLLAVDNDATMLGGAVALGVEEGTTGDFDDFQLRDSSPDKR